MKEVTDRVVQYPRRFKLTKVVGTEDEYELTPVPGTVQEAGTPINKELFDSIKTDIENEKTAREAKDTEHDTAISSNEKAISDEANTREQADIALSKSISDEAEAREQAIEAVDTKANEHIENKNNPHSVTKAQIGLSAVDNVRQYSSENKPPYPVVSVDGKKGAVDLSGKYAKQDGIYQKLISGGNTIIDTRTVNSPPSYYQDRRTCYEFKNATTVGLSEIFKSCPYVVVQSKKGWNGNDYIVYQEAFAAGDNSVDTTKQPIAYRYGVQDTWGEWQVVAKTSQVVRTDAPQALNRNQYENFILNSTPRVFTSLPTSGLTWKTVGKLNNYGLVRMTVATALNRLDYTEAEFILSMNYKERASITQIGNSVGSHISAVRLRGDSSANMYIDLQVSNHNPSSAAIAVWFDVRRVNASGYFETVDFETFSGDEGNYTITTLALNKSGINTTGSIYKNGAPVIAIEPTNLDPWADDSNWSFGSNPKLTQAGLYLVAADYIPSGSQPTKYHPNWLVFDGNEGATKLTAGLGSVNVFASKTGFTFFDEVQMKFPDISTVYYIKVS